MFDLLFNKTRVAILTLLFCNAGRRFHTRGIARETDKWLSTVHKELKILEEKGIVLSEKIGNSVLYGLNEKNPIYQELRGLVMKTTGIAARVGDTLQKLKDKIVLAFIYGSFANGTERYDSDLDILIVGDTSVGDVIEATMDIREGMGRAINPLVFPVGEFLEKLASKNHFLMSVLDAPKIFLIGDEDELGKLGAKQLHRETAV